MMNGHLRTTEEAQIVYQCPPTPTSTYTDTHTQTHTPQYVFGIHSQTNSMAVTCYSLHGCIAEADGNLLVLQYVRVIWVQGVWLF